MILEFSDWIIYVDKDATCVYYAEEADDRCNCSFCKNFYASVDRLYPDLRNFLSKFGVDIQTPESLIPLTPELYQASFIVQGKIIRGSLEPIWVNGIAVTLEEDTVSNSFIVNFGLMNIPWTLEEDPDMNAKPYGLTDIMNEFKQNITPQQI